MRELLETLMIAARQGRPLACCRLVETRGSTPQKTGAMMLVFADGSQAGTLGGGCVEAEVKRRALAVLDAGQGEIARFDLNDDYGWDDGLICGGRMQVLIDPVEPGKSESIGYYEALHREVENGRGAAEVIAFDAAACGLPATACYMFDSAGRLLAHARGPADGENAPQDVRQILAPLDGRPRPAVLRGLAFLPHAPRCRLIVVGGGHVGQAVAALAASVDFEVWVADDREEYVSAERFPHAQRRIAGPLRDVLPALEITPSTYCLIVTRGHNHDEEALYHLAERGACYVGMIGSRRKIKLIFEDLLSEGVSEQALAKVHAPVGLEIGSQSVPEIAISIVAELIAHRNLGEAAKRPAAVPAVGPRSATIS